VPEDGYKIEGLNIAVFNRIYLIKNVGLQFKLIRIFLQVRKILKSFNPDAVVGVGGYSTYPVLRSAQSRGIPTFIHESNSLPGKSNILLGKRATRIFVPSEGMNKYFPAEKISITGNPVRNIFLKEISKDDALKFFGLEADKKTVFVMGGSQGAKSINETINENIDAFKKNDLQLVWQTGKNYAATAAKAEEERMNIWTNAFIDKMEYAYAAADVVIARSGAMTIAEMCVVGKPAIFVPYPFSAEDHQVVNAKSLVDKNAALMVKDTEVKKRLIPELLRLVNNKELMEQLQNNISKLGNINADEVIAHEILNQIKKN
jgi:UDP-N-acetylglucosamine--N-acetylmuramyl-(pentapeptide) pyrophosphoryl-undecaprenol N-acetylglucosamine transferase